MELLIPFNVCIAIITGQSKLGFRFPIPVTPQVIIKCHMKVLPQHNIYGYLIE